MKSAGRASAATKRKRKPKPADIDRAGSSSSLEHLETGLGQALTQLSENGRRASMTALEAFLTFIDSVPGWERRNFGVPIWTLLAGLKDLEGGRVVAMLSPNPNVRNRKPESSMRKVIKAYAVSCVDILRKSGQSETEACRIVASELNQQGFPVGGRVGTPLWKTVKGWRDRISRRPANDQIREIVDSLRPQYRRLKSFSPEEAKQFAIGQLRELFWELGKTVLE